MIGTKVHRRHTVPTTPAESRRPCAHIVMDERRTLVAAMVEMRTETTNLLFRRPNS
jgi:hypothetical protein